MKISCLIMGTTLPQRLRWLEESIDYLDAQNFPFFEKVVFLDVFKGGSLDAGLEKKLSDSGWRILVQKSGDRSYCWMLALEEISGDVVFYNEDDILAKLPPYKEIEDIFSMKDDTGRECGMISMTLGGTKHDLSKSDFGDLVHASSNAIIKKDGRICFYRLESMRDDYFVEFPGLFVKKEIMEKCLEVGHYNVEHACTQKYFNQGLDKKFFKTTFCKDLLDHAVNECRSGYYQEVMEQTKLLKLLDNKQGGISWNFAKIPPL